MVIHQLHGCASRHVESVPVKEVYQRKTIWNGVVEVFAITGNPKADRCYAWSHREGKDDSGERFVAVLGVAPVNSPKTAVKIAIASEVKSKTARQSPKPPR